MNNIEIVRSSFPEIGYISRTTTKGEEYDMVEKYINFLNKKYKKLKYKKIAIFIEPQIDTGYPDLVIVEYYDSGKINWLDIRKKINNNDLKILFQFQKQKNTSLQDLTELLGYQKEQVRKSLTKLFESELIYFSKTQKGVRNVKLNRYCIIHKIISIEAKINKWSDALDQAARNAWFSNESYILLNKKNCDNNIINKCKKQGIGIILVNGNIVKILDSQKRDFPVSYASLQFNEWLLRYKHLGG